MKSTMELPLLSPYDWRTVLAFFEAHQVPFLETVDEEGYERVVNTECGLGYFRVCKSEESEALTLSVWNGSHSDVREITRIVRKMFDLDANPSLIAAAMSRDQTLSQCWASHPGLRVARAWSAYEVLFTTVLGQLVPVAFGRKLIEELMRAAGSTATHPKTGEHIRLFPQPDQILSADLQGLRTSQARRDAVRSLALLVQSGDLEWEVSADLGKLRDILRAVKGVGAWTTEYAALRGFQDDDAFPSTDYGLKQMVRLHPEMKVDKVRPLRSYAAVALWNGLRQTTESRKADESLL